MIPPKQHIIKKYCKTIQNRKPENHKSLYVPRKPSESFKNRKVDNTKKIFKSRNNFNKTLAFIQKKHNKTPPNFHDVLVFLGFLEFSASLASFVSF